MAQLLSHFCSSFDHQLSLSVTNNSNKLFDSFLFSDKITSTANRTFTNQWLNHFFYSICREILRVLYIQRDIKRYILADLKRGVLYLRCTVLHCQFSLEINTNMQDENLVCMKIDISVNKEFTRP